MTTETYNVWSLVIQGLIGFFIITTFIVYFLMLIAMRKGATGQNILSVIDFLEGAIRSRGSHYSAKGSQE